MHRHPTSLIDRNPSAAPESSHVGDYRANDLRSRARHGASDHSAIRIRDSINWLEPRRTCRSRRASSSDAAARG